MPILKIEMLSTQKSTMTILFIDFDFFPDLQGRFGWFVNLLLWLTKITQHIPDFCLKTNQEKLVCFFSCDVIPAIRISVKICNDILMERRKLLYR